MKATIEIRFPDGHTESRTLEDEKIVIGRGEVDVTLLDPKVSGRHAELSIADNRVTFTDLESTNGSTMDDGTAISGEVALLPGQGVVLGACRVGLVSVDLAPPAASAPAPAAKGKDLAFAGTIVGNPGMQMPAAPAAAPPPAAAAAAPVSASEPPTVSAPAATPAPAAPATPAAAVDPEAATVPEPDDGLDTPWNEAVEAPDTDGEDGGDKPWSIATAPAGAAADDNAPQGVPAGVAGVGMKNFGAELRMRLTTTWERLEPHLMVIGKFVAIVTVPFALANVLLGFIPVLGLLLSIPLSMLGSAIISLFVTGVVADYTLRVHRGEQASVSASMKAHMARIVPWAITLFIAGFMGFIGFFLLIVPAIMVTWATIPAFMVEDRRMVDAPMRGVRLFMKDWLHVLQVLAVGIIGVCPIYIGLAFISGFPGVRVFAPLAIALAQGFLIPFGMLYTYGAFFETRKRIENAGLQVS